jgi:hypothetical protein
MKRFSDDDKKESELISSDRGEKVRSILFQVFNDQLQFWPVDAHRNAFVVVDFKLVDEVSLHRVWDGRTHQNNLMWQHPELERVVEHVSAEPVVHGIVMGSSMTVRKTGHRWSRIAMEYLQC